MVGGMPREAGQACPALRHAQDKLGGGATGVNLCPAMLEFYMRINFIGGSDILLAELYYGGILTLRIC